MTERVIMNPNPSDWAEEIKAKWKWGADRERLNAHVCVFSRSPLSSVKPSWLILRRRSKPWLRALIFCFRSVCFCCSMCSLASPSRGEITFLCISVDVNRRRERTEGDGADQELRPTSLHGLDWREKKWRRDETKNKKNTHQQQRTESREKEKRRKRINFNKSSYKILWQC